MDHKLELLPMPGEQHPLLPDLIQAMWCNECKKWYFRDKDGNYPSVCPKNTTELSNFTG